MPVLDNALKTADLEVDVSAMTSDFQLETAAVNLGRAGLSKGEKFSVVVTLASAADLSAGVPYKAVFQYTTDNGTTYHDAGVAEIKSLTTTDPGDGGVPLQIVEGAVEVDIIPEQNAAADIDWRIAVRATANVATTDNFNIQGYLGGQGLGLSGVIN